VQVRKISSQTVALLISHELKRQERSRSWLARRLGVDVMWVSRRLNGLQPFKVDELEPIATALDMTAIELLDVAALDVVNLEIATEPDETFAG
jgi:transcriptional regulator with XRE-family HTH domain